MISGAFQYFRVHPAQWRQRIETLRYMGLDTIETVIPWNLHEPVPGEYSFEGFADLDAFLTEIETAGMRAIVRPGPYSCAELDNGGFPSWLTGTPGIRVRTSDPRYLEAVDRWFDVLIPLIAARQETRGGPIAMVQIENEYGSFGNDDVYMAYLRDGLRRRGIEVPLFTSDGDTDRGIVSGTTPGALATLNFGSRTDSAFAQLAKHRPDDPLICMEFWNGWFDHWGDPKHIRRDGNDAAAELDRVLSYGASVNLYMAGGGTSFGCTAGANHDGTYRPTVTSYDYDAPLDEAGQPTAKFWAIREVIRRHKGLTEADDSPLVNESDRLPPARVELNESLDLRSTFDSVASVHASSPYPLTYEELGIVHGLVRYRTHLRGPRETADLLLPQLADRAQVYVDGVYRHTFERDAEDARLSLDVPEEGAEIEILVESMGRVNFWFEIGEQKGLVGGVQHGPYIHGWTMDAMAFGLMPAAPDLPWSSTIPAGEGPGWRRGTLTVDRPADTFIALPGWGKGYIWVNGFCLGRYWDRGPQVTLYLPGPLLQPGENEILVLELDGVTTPAIELRSEPDLGPVSEPDLGQA